LATTTLAASEMAFAQDAAPETITVTGSQIKGDTTSARPITVITAEDLQRSNTVTLEQYLEKVPSFGQQGLTANSGPGGEGVSFIELRNLGVTRTLVLIDGQRMVSSGTDTVNAVDLNNIPVSMVERIEVLRDGASAIYGSDAIGGVVNIILKKHFDGALLSSQIGLSDKGDALTYDVNSTVGSNFDRGNVVFNAGYNHRDSLPQDSRDWATNKVLPNGSFSLGNTRTYGGHVQNPTAFDVVTGTQGINDEAFGNGVFLPYNAARDDVYTNDNKYLVGSLERRSFNALGHYDLLPNLTFTGDFLFTDHTTQQQLNPDSEGADIVTKTYPNGFIIPASNPYNPYGVDVTMRTRRAEVGNRQYNEEGPTYRLGAGLQGTIFGDYDWEAGYKYGLSDDKFVFTNQYNQTHILQVSGYLPCSAADVLNGCSVGNFFGPHSLTAAQAKYIGFTQTNTVSAEEDYAYGKITGPIMQLPAGPLNFALGGERRNESGNYQPDSTVTSGNADFDQAPTSGGYNVKEGYLELQVPVVKDKPFVKDLSLDGAARYSNYSNFGDATTWNAVVNYAPTEDIRFRFNTGTGFRAPGITDLYAGTYESAATVNDPCDVRVGSRSNGNTATNCNRVITAAGLNPATFTQEQTQLYTYIGGNPNLQPETSRQINVGTVITPRWTPGLSVSVDYYKIKLANQITASDPQTLLNNCYASANLSSPDCALIGTRINGQLTSVSAINVNAGFVHTSGLDFGFDYGFDLSKLGLPENAGHLTFNNMDTLLLDYVEQLPDGTVRHDEGTIISTSTPQAYTRFKGTASVNYSQPDWSVQWTTRYIGGSSNYVPPGSTLGTGPGNKVPAVVYNDIVGTYTLKGIDTVKEVTLTAGIDNLFDKDPPFYLDGSTNSLTNSYDYIGRFFYVKASVKF
jgi:outer membrane receptor protein involved in Fe transport